MTDLMTLGLPTSRTAGLGESHVVRARRDHACVLCDWTIPKGDHHWVWSLPPGWGDGDYWFTGRAHAVCIAVYRCSEWYDPYEALPDPWDFRREVLGDVVWATSNVVAFT